MTKKEQVKDYWKALFHYTLSWINPFLETKFKTCYGFCHYFALIQYKDLINYTELVALSPQKNYVGYWFEYGKKLPRIKLLIKAIINCYK